MSDEEVSFAEQLSAVEMQALGVRDLIERAADGKIKRTPEWLETKTRRLKALRAAYRTILDVQRAKDGK